MARMAKFVGVAALGLALTGCVSTEKYNALKLDRDSLAEQLGKANNDATAARAEADSYKSQIGMLGQNNQGVSGLVNNLQQQNSTLQAQLDEMNRRYAEAMSRS